MPIRKRARIVGMGSYLPEKILSNKDLESLVDTSDDWIVTRTGIRERRIAADDEFTSDMGVEAAERALAAASLQTSDLDLILVATMTPDYLSPSTAALVQRRLGAEDVPAMDLSAACSGFIYGLSMAKAYIESGQYRSVLLVAAEKMSAFMDYKDRATCVLFGDGAAAAVVMDQGSGLYIDNISLGADGSLADLVAIPGGGSRHPASAETIGSNLHTFKMSGKELFRHAVRRIVTAARGCLVSAGVSDQQISWLVPHQANARIVEAVAKGLDLPAERTFLTLEKYGNTSASGVAIALEELWRTRHLSIGEHLLLVAFGGGLTWGAALLTYKSDL